MADRARAGGVLVIAIAGLPFALAVPSVSRGEDLRVLHLESEVRRLQRELDTQARRIDQLERAARNSVTSRALSNGAARTDSSPAWLVSSNWERLRPGMKVTDVVALLGRPTSVRTGKNGKVESLWYALELGPGAVLTGNVQLNDAGLSKVNKPVLR